MKRSIINTGMALTVGIGMLIALLGLLSSKVSNAVYAQGPDGYAIYYVAPGGSCGSGINPCYDNIQDAVDAVDALDDIVKVSAGTYVGINNYGGSSQMVYISKTVIIRGGYTIANWTAAHPLTQPTTLNAQGQGRVIYITDNINPVIEGLHITGGSADRGGGIYIVNAKAVISGNVISSNAADYGGGLYLIESAAKLISNTISDNTGSWDGGGLVLSGSPATLEGNTIVSNTSDSSAGGVRLYQSHDAILTDNTIAFNYADSRGGGLFLSSSDATLVGNTVSSNTARSGGGGLYLSGGAPTLDSNAVLFNITRGFGGGVSLSGSDAKLVDNLIMGNEAYGAPSGGGGVYVTEKNAVLQGNAIISNTADQHGGGVYVNDDKSTLVGNTISGNNAGWNGGGVAAKSSSATLDGNTVLTNAAGWYGGGVSISSYGDVKCLNNIIAHNYASSGGGLYVDYSSSRLLHSTFVRNTSDDGTGIYVTTSGGANSTALFTNTILVGHTTALRVTSGNTANLEATLWGVGIWANTTDWDGTGTIITGEHNYWANPRFLDPDAGEYHIGLDSSAIDKGINTWVTDDIDGQTRPHYGVADLGADEWWPLITTKSAVPDIAEAGEVVTYTLALRNVTTAMMHVSFTDTLPSQVTYLDGPVFSGGNGSCVLGVVTWTGTVYTDTSMLITWTVRLLEDVPYSTTITNTAVVSDVYGVFETNPAIVWVPPYRIHLPLIMRQLE